MPAIEPSYIRRTINYTAKIRPNKKVLSESVELVPKGNSNILSETIYQPVFYDGKLSQEIQKRTVLKDSEHKTRTIFEEHFPESPKAPQRRIEVTDRTSKSVKSYGYGYGDENMKRIYEREWSNDGLYINKEHSEYIGCINHPNCSGSRTDIYNKDAHLHYVDGRLYQTHPPVFYNNFGRVEPT